MQLKKSNLSINTAVFEAFKSFTHDDANVRIKGAHGLIKILQDTDEEKVSSLHLFMVGCEHIVTIFISF